MLYTYSPKRKDESRKAVKCVFSTDISVCLWIRYSKSNGMKNSIHLSAKMVPHEDMYANSINLQLGKTVYKIMQQLNSEKLQPRLFPRFREVLK